MRHLPRPLLGGRVMKKKLTQIRGQHLIMGESNNNFPPRTLKLKKEKEISDRCCVWHCVCVKGENCFCFGYSTWVWHTILYMYRKKKKQNGQEMNNYPIITRIVDNRRYACVFGKGDNIWKGLNWIYFKFYFKHRTRSIRIFGIVPPDFGKRNFDKIQICNQNLLYGFVWLNTLGSTLNSSWHT